MLPIVVSWFVVFQFAEHAASSELENDRTSTITQTSASPAARRPLSPQVTLMLGPAHMGQPQLACGYRPVNCGLRFSTKARAASSWSLVDWARATMQDRVFGWMGCVCIEEGLMGWEMGRAMLWKELDSWLLMAFARASKRLETGMGEEKELACCC